MQFHITKLILWPRDTKKDPRIVSFSEGKLNVISGRSRTGKSSIIPIIDYCLASDSCLIPVNVIRDTCLWFGIVVQTAEGEKLFARKEPGLQQSTSESYVLEGEVVEIPKTIPGKNATADDIKTVLNRLSGLTSMTFSTDDGPIGFRGRPSFRDIVAFAFQPQNIIANPDVLFYKAHTYEHRERLQIIFPYVLGALTATTLAKRHELAQLQKELRKKERELTSARSVSQRWVAEIDAKLAKAADYGLAKQTSSIQSFDDKLSIVRNIVQKSKAEVHTSLSTIHESVKELGDLQTTESQLSGRLVGLKRRYSEALRLRKSSQQYVSALTIQRDRLSLAQFVQNQAEENSCLMCGGKNDGAVRITKKLLKELHNLEGNLVDVQDSPTVVDDEIYKLRRRIRDVTQDLDSIQTQREMLQRTSKAAQSQHYSALSVSRFIGTLEESLELYEKLGSDSKSQQEVAELSASVEALRKDIDEGKIKARETAALTRISNYAGRLLPNLDCERPNDPIELSIPDLNVKIRGKDRTDVLSEIGSGSNWLSYHVAILLALHQLFLEQAQSPVPSFIVLDQPSQVYFPTVTSKSAESKIEDDYDFTDEDIVAVFKTYKVLFDVVNAAEAKLQVIVVDHAGDAVWGELAELNFVEEWRGDEALVPLDWTHPK